MFEYVKLKELCTVNQGLQIPISMRKKEPGPNRYFYITVQFLKNNIDNYYIENPPIATTCSKDEILMVRTGNTGQVITGVEGCFHNNFFKVKPNERIISKYMFYVLKSDLMYKRILNAASGTTIPDLKHSSFYELDIPLPTIEIQKKISDMLECIDKKIETNSAINRNLEDQAQAIFKEWFIDNSENASWPVGTFSDLIVSTLSGDWGKEEETGNFTERVYCIRGADIPDVKTGNKGKMPTRYILSKNFKAKQLVAGDIVVEISGGSPTQSTGRVAAISKSLLDRYDRGMVCTNFCRALKPKSGYSMFIYYYWQYLYDRKIFFLYENGTTGIKNLDINGFLENEEIILPPKELVDKFDDFCNTTFDQIFKNGIETEKLAETRDSLLPKLMSGELDVSVLDL